MEALLEYRQTDVCYGGVRAVRGVSFTLHAGEILGVVGESGCGKSTLLRAAMGLLGPGGLVTGGKILYRGENLPDLSHRARRRLNGPELGMIFQSAGSAFCPVRRVGDQLYEMMRAHGPMDKRAFRQQAGALLDRLGLEDGPRILNSYPFELSGGMQQRVGIAAAMLLRPRVLLLPLATTVGTFAGAALASITLAYSLSECLAVGSGFAYYSLSSIFITQYKGAELGTVALLANIMRELATLLFTPLMVRWISPLAAISCGGASTMDSTLPVITRFAGKQWVFVSIVHAMILDFSVPFWVTFFCTL